VNRRLTVTALAYLVPTFALGFVWHLIAFKATYDMLAIYRKDMIIPFGLLAMCLQAVAFAWLLDVAFSKIEGAVRRRLGFALFGAVLSWSYTTASVAATSVPDYLVIESAFTVVQWAIVGPLMDLARSAVRSAADGDVTVQAPRA
jgi:hypothetical protein